MSRARFADRRSALRTTTGVGSAGFKEGGRLAHKEGVDGAVERMTHGCDHGKGTIALAIEGVHHEQFYEREHTRDRYTVRGCDYDRSASKHD